MFGVFIIFTIIIPALTWFLVWEIGWTEVYKALRRLGSFQPLLVSLLFDELCFYRAPFQLIYEHATSFDFLSWPPSIYEHILNIIIL